MSRMFTLVFMLPALGLLGGAWYTYSGAEELATDGDRVTGTVVSIRSSTDSEGDTTYAPVYSYERDGQRLQYSPDATSSSAPRIGDTDVLFVDPDDPANVMADTFMDRWFLPVLLGGMGVVFLVVSLAVIGGMRRSRRRAQGPHSWSPSSDEPVTRTASTRPSATDVESTTNRSGPFVDGSSSSDSRGPFL